MTATFIQSPPASSSAAPSSPSRLKSADKRDGATTTGVPAALGGRDGRHRHRHRAVEIVQVHADVANQVNGGICRNPRDRGRAGGHGRGQDSAQVEVGIDVLLDMAQQVISLPDPDIDVDGTLLYHVIYHGLLLTMRTDRSN